MAVAKVYGPAGSRRDHCPLRRWQRRCWICSWTPPEESSPRHGCEFTPLPANLPLELTNPPLEAAYASDSRARLLVATSAAH
eukprot:2530512-Pyramimonas_sp.AAC.1